MTITSRTDGHYDIRDSKGEERRMGARHCAPTAPSPGSSMTKSSRCRAFVPSPITGYWRASDITATQVRLGSGRRRK